MLLMFAGNLTGETVSAQSFSYITKMFSKLTRIIKKNPKETLQYSGFVINKLHRDSVLGKGLAPKTNLYLGDSLFVDKSGKQMQLYIRKNAGLTSKDTTNVEDPQVSSNEFFHNNNANRPKMFWEQLQGSAK